MATRTASAEPYVPANADLDRLRAAVNRCQGCDLYRDAIQAVFSSGTARARVVMVGETPGDIEDRKGRPFAGPGGAILKRAMAEVGIPAGEAYLTNAVKHFKFHYQHGGTRRIHDKPRRSEIVACRPWLRAEFSQLRPRVVVALGATAAEAMAGPRLRVTRNRGKLFNWSDVAEDPDAFASPSRSVRFLATVHPAAVLRAEEQDPAYEQFLADLRAAASAAG